MPATATAVRRHLTRLAACRLCPRMHRPVVVGRPVASRVLLVGQAPGDKEPKLGRPFAWTAGKTLFKWFHEALGWTEDETRDRIYFAAVCRCFPGKKPAGGDRVPDDDEIANCARWLAAEVELLRPALVLPVGKLAIGRFLPAVPLNDTIGKSFRIDWRGHAMDCIPLPHPSGASPWHRMEPGRTLLRQALGLVTPARGGERLTMAAGETAAHRELKRLALRWAAGAGFGIAAAEVRVPRSGFRADVAAYARGTRTRPVRTAILECKQARADLLKDARAEKETRARLTELLARRAKLEELLAEHRPDLRRGETLFPEFDAIDTTGLRHETYAAVIDEIATLQARLLHGVKFDRLRRYAAADALYLVVEEGIFADAEIPAGWGLLVRERGAAELRLVRPPLRLEPAPGARVALLESIAAAACRTRAE